MHCLCASADLLAAAKTAGITVPIYAGDAAADYTLFQGLRGRPSVLANLTVLSIAPGTPAFVKAFSKFTGTNATASYQAYAAHAYDATIAVMKAYKAALPPKDGPAIKQQLQKEAFKGKCCTMCRLSMLSCIGQTIAIIGSHAAVKGACVGPRFRTATPVCTTHVYGVHKEHLDSFVFVFHPCWMVQLEHTGVQSLP